MGARFRLPEGLDRLLRSELERAIYEAALNESDTLIATRYIVEKVAQIDIAAELGWTDREQATLSAARQALWDIEQTPASYYYNRNILNAFRRVVYNYETPRDVIGRYAREIDRELVRKRKQLG